MAKKAFHLKLAAGKGEKVSRENRFTSLPVDPFVIAENNGIQVQAKPESAEGVSGMLLRHGDNFGIAYATHIRSEGFQRFSIAHELGHYFLDGHVDHILPDDGVHISHAGFVSTDPYELEADAFAAGLLMPDQLFKRALGKFSPGLEAIEGLHEVCRTSLTATAMRYAELTEDAVAVVLCSGSSIDFCRMSDTLKVLPQISWLKKGDPVPKGSGTSELNADPARIKNGNRDEREIDIMDWLGGVKSVPAVEQIVGLGNYGKTLTVLTCNSLVEESYRDEDDELEDELEESWTPRFRR